MAEPLRIMASGMVTGVGLNMPASCAAIRCSITNFVETRFMDQGGEWIIGCPVPLAEPWRGRAKLVQLVIPAIRECLQECAATKTEDIALLLCVAETTRPGRFSWRRPYHHTKRSPDCGPVRTPMDSFPAKPARQCWWESAAPVRIPRWLVSGLGSDKNRRPSTGTSRYERTDWWLLSVLHSQMRV
jgi:hypothetical protein